MLCASECDPGEDAERRGPAFGCGCSGVPAVPRHFHLDIPSPLQAPSGQHQRLHLPPLVLPDFPLPVHKPSFNLTSAV